MGASSGLQYLWPLLKKHRGSFFAAITFLALEATCDLMQPTLMAQLINQGVVNHDLGALVFWAGLMLAFVAVGAVAAVCRNLLSARVGQGFGGDLRSRAFGHVMAMQYHQVRNWDAATLQTRLTFDVTQVQNLVNGLMRLYLKAPLLGLGALLLMFSLDARLAILVLPVVAVVYFLFRRQLSLTLPLFQKSQALLDEMSARARDFLHGVRVVKAFGRQNQARHDFAEANCQLSSVAFETQTIQAAFSPTVSWTVGLAVVAVLLVGGLGVGADRQLIGHMMAFVQYLTQMLFALIIVTSLVGIVSRARTSALRIGEVLAVVPEIRAPRRVPDLPRLELRGVWLGHGEEPILQGLSFSVPEGQSLGILGSTGSGKTSLLHLVVGLQPPTQGEVLLPPWSIAFVPQRALLFRGTVLDNLTWGSTRATEGQVLEVLRVTDADEFVHQLPSGLQTLLGPGGVTLSGGQRQRLTLARALLSRPQLLVLDEAFSALDLETERRIEARLEQAFPHLTRVMVAQKASSVHRCDAVLVLDKGRCEAWGPPLELSRRSVLYRQICQSQGWDLDGGDR